MAESSSTGCCTGMLAKVRISKCLLWDRISESGSFYDSDPCGAYVTTRVGGVDFVQVGVAHPEYIECPTARSIDKLVAKVLLAVARDTHRYVRVDQTRLKGILWRIPQQSVYVGSGLRGLVKGSTTTNVLPPNLVVCLDGHPEELGLLSLECGRAGVFIREPHRVGVIEVCSELGKRRAVAA